MNGEKCRTWRQWTADVLIVAFFAVFLTFVIYAPIIKSMANYGERCLPGEYSTISIFFMSFFLLGLLAWAYFTAAHTQTRLRKYLYLPLMLFLTALLLRLFVVLCMGFGTNQISDFQMAFSSAGEPIPIDLSYYKAFSNWGLYSAYLRLITSVFGYSEFTGIIFNAILSSLSVVLLYFICALSFRRLSVALLASALFNFFPSHLLFTIVLSPDFVNLFLILLAVFILCIARRRFREKLIKKLLLYAAAGGILGLASFFKLIDKIVFVALAITMVIDWLSDIREKNPEIPLWKRLLNGRTAAVLLSFLCSLDVIQAGFAYLDYYVGERVNRSAMSHFLYMGLNPFGEGRWTEKTAIYVKVVENNSFDYEKADRVMYDRLRYEVREHQNLNFEFFDKKADTAWGDTNYLYFIDSTMNKEKKAAVNRWEWLMAFIPFSEAYYVMVAFLLGIGALCALLRRERGMAFFSGLIVFGFALLLFVSEVQPRYKTVVYPYMLIVAAYGVDSVAEGIERLLPRLLKKKKAARCFPNKI